MATIQRNCDLATLAEILQDEKARALDVVVPASELRFENGYLIVPGAESELTPDGVTAVDGQYWPTEVGIDGMATKLGIPPQYARTLLRTDGMASTLDANVNGWLRHIVETARSENRRVPSFLVRALSSEGGDGQGVLRAFLSDRFKPIDNVDVLFAALDGIRAAGVDAQIDSCDLTDSRMHVRIVSEAVKVMAPELLRNYRSPFEDGERRAGGWTVESGRRAAAHEGMGFRPGAEPVVFAGFEIRNSDVGLGSYQLVPRIVVQICRNGLTIPLDAMESRHLGARLESGIVQSSDETLRRVVNLITSQTTDAVRTFLSREYVQRKVADIAEKAATPVTNGEETIKRVATPLRWSEGQRESILQHFLMGGQRTAGGVMQAVTSVAQTVASADSAAELEDSALKVLDLAARVAI